MNVWVCVCVYVCGWMCVCVFMCVWMKECVGLGMSVCVCMCGVLWMYVFTGSVYATNVCGFFFVNKHTSSQAFCFPSWSCSPLKNLHNTAKGISKSIRKNTFQSILKNLKELKQKFCYTVIFVHICFIYTNYLPLYTNIGFNPSIYQSLACWVILHIPCSPTNISFLF